MMTEMNILALNPHVRPWSDPILVRPGSEAARDTDKNKRPAVSMEQWAQTRLLTFGPWGIGTCRERRGEYPNHSICYPLPLAPSPHSRPGTQDILKWRRLLVGICLKPSNDWLEAEVPGHEPSTPEFMGANQPAEPKPLIPPDRQFSLSNAAGFGAKNIKLPCSLLGSISRPWNTCIFKISKSINLFLVELFKAVLTFVEQWMRVQLSPQIATWETSCAWKTAQKNPEGFPLPAGNQVQEMLLDQHRSSTLSFCLNDFREWLHMPGQPTFKGSSFFLRFLPLKSGSLQDSSDWRKINTAHDSSRDTNVNNFP